MLATYPQKLVATKKSSNLSRPWFSFLQSLLDLLQTPRRFFGHHSMGDKLTLTWDSPKTVPFPNVDSWTSLMIEVMVVSTVTWLSAMLPKVEAMRFCISLANGRNHRCLNGIQGCLSRLPHLLVHLNSFMIYIYIHIIYCNILHLSQSLVYALNTKSQNQAKSIFFLIFSHVHHHQTIKLLIKLWLITKSQKLHQCLSQASVLKDPRIGFWLASMEMFQLPFWGVKPSRQAAFLAPQLGGPQQTLLEFPVQILLSLSGLEKKVLNAEQSHTDTIYIYIV